MRHKLTTTMYINIKDGVIFTLKITHEHSFINVKKKIILCTLFKMSKMSSLNPF